MTQLTANTQCTCPEGLKGFELHCRSCHPDDSPTSKPVVQEGPTVSKSCIGCHWLRSDRFSLQGDSGSDYTCQHERGKGYIGCYYAKTPDWCPFDRPADEPEAWSTKDLAKRLREFADGSNYGCMEDLQGDLLGLADDFESGTFRLSPPPSDDLIEQLSNARLAWQRDCRCSCSGCAAFDLKLRNALTKEGNQAEASSSGDDRAAPTPRGSLPNSLGNEHLYQPDQEWMAAPLGAPGETNTPLDGFCIHGVWRGHTGECEKCRHESETPARCTGHDGHGEPDCPVHNAPSETPPAPVACGVNVGFNCSCRRERGHAGPHTWDPKRLYGEEPL